MRNWIKNSCFALVIVVAVSFVNPAKVLAVQIDYGGDYLFTDKIGGDSFRETLSFSSPVVLPGIWPDSGLVIGFDPPGDSIFSDATDLFNFETVKIKDLTLDPSPSEYVSGSYFTFNPTIYEDGFEIHDYVASVDTLLLTADLTVETLEIVGTGGVINSVFTMNLANIQAGGSYTPGSSLIIDGFIAAGIAGTTISLQFEGDLSEQIINAGADGNPFGSTYSGAAATSVPEPTTMLLLGIGLAGLGVVGMREKRRKE